MELLFDEDDRVGYVTGDVWQDSEGKWVPSKGIYDRTAGELIASLKKHSDDIGATVGDWKPEVGGWIRFNPLDGEGVKNENVTKFKYALVESDTLPIAEQDILFRKLELPIAALVHSGGKSLHAIVRVDAADGSGRAVEPCPLLFAFPRMVARVVLAPIVPDGAGIALLFERHAHGNPCSPVNLRHIDALESRQNVSVHVIFLQSRYIHGGSHALGHPPMVHSQS